jgi:two-component system, OmpR family, sensor histidine kinase CpxA
MHRLFWKIFLWFWLGIVVVSATLVVSTALTRSRSLEDEHWRQRYALPVDLRAQRTAELFDRAGVSGVEKYLGPLERRDPMKDYVFNEEGREVFGRHAPPKVLRALAMVRQHPGGEHYFFSQARVAAEKALAPSGRAYVLVMTFPPRAVWPRQLLQFLFDDIGRDGILRLISVLLVAAFFCFWLARQITRPIEKLRLATHEIAHERLEARVDEEVTDRRDELGELGQDFNRMAERIGKLVTTQRQLLAHVSHELRSPLARLNLALGLARQRNALESSEHLDRIEHETERLNHLIGQLLALARIDSAVDLERKSIFDLGALVREIAADADYEARGRHSTVQLSASSECPVEGAPEMLRGAIENVVRNAVRHTAEGTPVEVTLESCSTPGGHRAVIRVRDYGQGVPEESLLHLFTPFYRVTNGAGRHPDGSGLGLAITERAIRLHGGQASAANAPGGGLLVILELPAAGPDQVEEASRRMDAS